ncbi:Sulfite oxidase [Fulvia fulva]|nr:Sulfite oxidase [Fulvia fulva]KAK4613158.1 Sulfite oxidase [Fulvia fulva]WPV21197.1 Sulfite oxidase [Fulvia fulva]WPV36266.1 Sulfite oxidase [Fulvia fulva]
MDTTSIDGRVGDRAQLERARVELINGFYFRAPPDPHKLSSYITPDHELFQTIHMGAAVIDNNLWRLDIHGLVERPYSLTLAQLRAMPSSRQTSFHECYGSPIKPPTEACRRIGNVTWTGARLRDLLAKAAPLPSADFLWSDGLDCGSFADVKADRYQKDLPLAKAMSEEVLVAYEINGKPLDVHRGGPVRLIVPGWFGTNSTKWLCSLKLEKGRSPSPFTMTFYNELVPGREAEGIMRPVWEVEPNSIIVHPAPEEQVTGHSVDISGWAWSDDGIRTVEISVDDGRDWTLANVAAREGFEWQAFNRELDLEAGNCTVTIRATSTNDIQQPLSGRRNHVHSVHFTVT